MESGWSPCFTLTIASTWPSLTTWIQWWFSNPFWNYIKPLLLIKTILLKLLKCQKILISYFHKRKMIVYYKFRFFPITFCSIHLSKASVFSQFNLNYYHFMKYNFIKQSIGWSSSNGIRILCCLNSSINQYFFDPDCNYIMISSDYILIGIAIYFNFWNRSFPIFIQRCKMIVICIPFYFLYRKYICQIYLQLLLKCQEGNGQWHFAGILDWSLPRTNESEKIWKLERKKNRWTCEKTFIEF